MKVTPAKKFRTAREATAHAIHEALRIIEILRKLRIILNTHKENNKVLLKNRRPQVITTCIEVSGDELQGILGAMRDYVTLRIANIVDPHNSALSLKNLNAKIFEDISNVPEIKEILKARDNWIGHINKRYIGPIDSEILYGERVISILNRLDCLVSRNEFTEDSELKYKKA